MPKLNLYRNISITFAVFVVVLLVIVFFFLSSKATVIVTPNPQKISLSFNLEAKEKPTAEELLEKDIVAGKIASYVKKGSLTADILSTKTVDSKIVGQVKIVNASAKDQALVKTTQLQAENGVIVRTTDNIIAPAGGSVNVFVVAKDPADFKNIEPGDLVIIKLNPALQAKIYAVAEKALDNNPKEIKVLTDSDIKRAKEQLSQKLADEIKTENNILANNILSTEVKSFTTDKKIGDEADSFNLEMEVEIKALDVNEEQLASLIAKKVANLNLSGLAVGQVNVSDINYTILEDDLDGSVLVKINYSILASIDENNSLLNKASLAGRKIKEVEELLSSQEIIKDVEILISPYWNKSFPKQASKINIIVK
ncbi:MAG: hypothetical protein Q7K65_01545 [Candidatus Buchananbacteria bacterium]|nr:hypothetical protein [Candidatus Buchananbacteria bacterium]